MDLQRQLAQMHEMGIAVHERLENNFPGLPHDCIKRLLSYLNNEDSSALMDAGKPSVYCRRS